MVILFRQLREISGPIAEEILVVLRYQVDTNTTLGITHENKETYRGRTVFMTHQTICGGVYLQHVRRNQNLMLQVLLPISPGQSVGLKKSHEGAIELYYALFANHFWVISPNEPPHRYS